MLRFRLNQVLLQPDIEPGKVNVSLSNRNEHLGCLYNFQQRQTETQHYNYILNNNNIILLTTMFCGCMTDKNYLKV